MAENGDGTFVEEVGVIDDNHGVTRPGTVGAEPEPPVDLHDEIIGGLTDERAKSEQRDGPFRIGRTEANRGDLSSAQRVGDGGSEAGFPDSGRAEEDDR